jgi:hypothetical protein
MNKLKIYCTSVIHRKILDKLPEYLIPLGVGKGKFPKHWLNEQSGDNIVHLNKFYGEHTGIYWVWKNKIKELDKNDWVGFCHYRKFWLNEQFIKKQKFSFNNLYANLLRHDNNIFFNNDVLLVQPIVYSNKNLFQDFKDTHKSDVLEKSLSFLEENKKKSFEAHLNANTLYGLNMFVTKVKHFENYCENVFPWLEKCYNYCEENDLLKNYNIRLPSFLSERFVSSWFSQFDKKKTLSYVRLGNFFLSDKINSIINPLKLPFSMHMYPTLHRY